MSSLKSHNLWGPLYLLVAKAVRMIKLKFKVNKSICKTDYLEYSNTWRVQVYKAKP